MSNPVTTVPNLPDIPEALAESQNPVHKLSAAMLRGGLDMLREAYKTIANYTTVKSQAEDLLKTSDKDEVKRFRTAKAQASAADAQDRKAAEDEMRPIKERLDAKIKERSEQLRERFYVPAMNALNLDAGVNENAYGEALTTSAQLTDSLKLQAAQVSKQGIDMSSFVLPKVNTGTTSSGEIGFTPKFSAATITTKTYKDGTVVDTTTEQLESDKLKNTDIVKRLKVKRQFFLQRFTADWNGDESPWRDAAPGMVHTFNVSKLNPRYEDGVIQDGIVTDITVTKAARVKAQTPTGETIEVDIPDPTDVDDDDEANEGEPIPATF